VLILDEPTEGIQPSIIKDIAKLLNQIKVTKDLAIIVTEQVLSFTLEIADHMHVIETGEFVHYDAKSAINEEKIKGYLSV
jgi:urea transport system ATP-binding protein